jgi:hypothetical protein
MQFLPRRLLKVCRMNRSFRQSLKQQNQLLSVLRTSRAAVAGGPANRD